MLFILLIVMLIQQCLSLPAIEPIAHLKLLNATSYATAKCLDGTQSGYYYEPASDVKNSKKWVIRLQGGGECTTEESCRPKLSQGLGSSKYFPKTLKQDFLTSADPTANPTLHSWNRVYIPYCTQVFFIQLFVTCYS